MTLRPDTTARAATGGRAPARVEAFLARFVERVAAGRDRELDALVATEGDLRSLFEVFGSSVLRELVGRPVAADVRLLGFAPDAGGGVATLRAAPGCRPATAWLLRGADGWRVADLYPLAAGDDVPPDVVALFAGEKRLEVRCEPDELRAFLAELYHWAKPREPEASLFEIAAKLAQSKALWLELDARGYTLRLSLRSNELNDLFDGTLDGRPVVVKALHSTRERMRERFLREVAILEHVRGLDGVLRLVEAGEVAGAPFLVTERVEGTSIADALAGGVRWSEPDKARIALDTARLACRLYARDVVHRDVCTDHVFVRPDLTVGLIDFGVSRRLSLLDDGRRRRYLAREVRNLGLCLAYLLIEARRPAHELFGDAEHLEDTWREAVRELRAAPVDARLASIAERAIAADPDVRHLAAPDDPPYARVQGFLADLGRWLDDAGA